MKLFHGQIISTLWYAFMPGSRASSIAYTAGRANPSRLRSERRPARVHKSSHPTLFFSTHVLRNEERASRAQGQYTRTLSSSPQRKPQHSSAYNSLPSEAGVTGARHGSRRFPCARILLLCRPRHS